MASQSSLNPGRGGQQGSPQNSSRQASSTDGSTQDAVFYSKMLDNLLEIIRDADQPSFSRVVAAIRSGASNDQINQLLEEILQRITRSGSRA